MDRLLRTVVALVLALGLSVAFPVATSAQSCAPRLSFLYPGGEKGCISDQSVAKETAVGLLTSIEKAVPPTGIYSVAAAPRGESCPSTVGMVVLGKYVNGASTFRARDAPDERAKTAISDWQKKVDTTKPEGSSCACKLILEDGTSPMSRAALESFLASAAIAPK
jgi:hypothetical protein